jgi:peptide/nickel transport system permease protein
VRFFRDLWRICKSDKPAFVGGVVIVIYLVVAIVGPFVTRVTYQKNPALAYLPPSLKYPLGTDFLGNSVLTELIVGTRPIMEVGIASAVMVVVVGVAVGLVAGYLGGVTDQIVMRITDVFLTIPGLPLLIVIASVVRSSSPLVLAAILSVTGWAGLARAVRSQALSLRTSDFIDAAKVQGLPLRNMVSRQLLPNVGPYVAIHFLLAVTGAIYAEVGLYLLGVAPITGTNWGIMMNLAISQGALYTSQSVLYLFSPMLAIVFLQVALVFFSRAMDQLFNPRLRVVH